MVTAISIWLCYDRQPLRSDSHAVQCPHFCTCYPSFWKCGDSKASLWPLDNQPDAIIRGVRMLDLSGSDVDVLPNQSPAHNFPDLQLIILAQTIFDGQQCRELECLESLGIRVIAPRCPADKRTGCAYPPCCPWAAAARTRPRPPPSPTTDKSQSPLLPFINGETSTIFNPSRDREYSTRAMAPSTVGTNNLSGKSDDGERVVIGVENTTTSIATIFPGTLLSLPAVLTTYASSRKPSGHAIASTSTLLPLTTSGDYYLRKVVVVGGLSTAGKTTTQLPPTTPKTSTTAATTTTPSAVVTTPTRAPAQLEFNLMSILTATTVIADKVFPTSFPVEIVMHRESYYKNRDQSSDKVAVSNQPDMMMTPSPSSQPSVIIDMTALEADISGERTSTADTIRITSDPTSTIRSTAAVTIPTEATLSSITPPTVTDAADPSTYVPNIATTSQPILATHPLINTAADMGILPPLLLASHPGENISAAVSKSNDTELFVLNSSSNADVGQSERFELSSLSAGKDSDDDDDDEPLTTVVGLLLSPTTTPATLALPDATDRIVPCANISCPPCLLVGSSDGSAEVRMGLLADRFTAASIAVASVILLLVVILCILWKRGYRVIRGGGGGGAGSNQQDDGGDEDNDRSRGRRSASVWSWMRGVFNNNRDNSSSGGTNDDVNRRGMGLGRQIPGGYDGRRGDGRGGVSTNPIFNPGRQQHHGFSPVANRDSRTPTRHMPSPRPADYNPVLDDRVMNCFNDDSDHDHDYGNNDNNRRDRQQQVAGNNNARLLAEYRADDRESPVYSSPRSDVSRVIVSAEVHGRNNADQEQDEQGEHMYENVPLPALPLQPSSPNRSVSIGSADELMSGNSSAPPPISPHHNVRSSSMSRLEEVPEREEEEDDDDQHRVQAHDEEHGDNLVLERESSEHDGGGSGGQETDAQLPDAMVANGHLGVLRGRGRGRPLGGGGHGRGSRGGFQANAIWNRRDGSGNRLERR
ncbi:uncharacterized protein LOC129585578 isoform X2 [Paramacrobiotus metropolitanus]|uniref:uncharacterized protein LOC129585578 isoform X2 n=1 Tax=Paramacrobiotus metropolitanus TaxID=2943436 RepID=UPI00244655D4|nr:uncharacterized protein LOC129585578 isoform X2 [Paramacrobiotus metropolitanus]